MNCLLFNNVHEEMTSANRNSWPKTEIPYKKRNTWHAIAKTKNIFAIQMSE
jgi:hypothetical protein